MSDSAPLDRMQMIADYRAACKFLVQSGKQGIMFGCVSLFIGISVFNNQLFDYLYLGVGTVYLLIGLHNRYYPSAFGIILDGIMLILLGVWNLSLQAVAVWVQQQPSIFSGVFGAMMIFIGLIRFRRYPRVKAAFDDPPSEDQIAWFDDVVKEVRDATPDAAADVFEFRAGLLWKGKRFGDMVIFVDKMDFETLIVDRRDIDFDDKGKTLFGAKRRGSLRIGKRKFGLAEIQPEMVTLLEVWRTDSFESSPIDNNG